jgi:hypothetical protein
MSSSLLLIRELEAVDRTTGAVTPVRIAAQLAPAGQDTICTLTLAGVAGPLGAPKRVYGVDAMAALGSAIALAEEILRLAALDAELRWLDGSRYDGVSGG